MPVSSTGARTAPAYESMAELARKVLPGTSKETERLRDAILDFCGSLSSKTVLLRGPIGSGKSTAARLIGYLKRLAPQGSAEVERGVRDVRFDGPNRIDVRMMPWYVELALTGLVESLAESQLFGSVKGAFTNAVDRAGVFERARQPLGHDREVAGSGVTGGVVFLDEVGDLNEQLQAKLLPVLSGGVFYRIGGEGQERHEVQFHGVTIAASWRRLDDGTLRPDLLSRLSAYVIDVPGIDERDDDFAVLLDEVETLVRNRFRAEVERVILADPAIDRAYWRGRADALPQLGTAIRRQLSEVDWARHGNLRGLRHAVEQLVIDGRPLDAVLECVPLVGVVDVRADDALISSLGQRQPDGRGLASHVRAVELEQRRELRDRLSSDAAAKRRLARVLGIAESRFDIQLQQLDRRRSAHGDDA